MQELTFKDVSKTFGNLTVLEGINFTVHQGELCAIVGPSGCGKSTLLRMCAGIESPTSGSVLANHSPIKGPDAKRMMIFQDSALYPWLTIESNVGFGLELAGVPKEERRERAKAMMAKVGLAGFETYYPHQLSGGMKQRASIARALVMDPDTLLLDEPYGALDALTRVKMQEELLKLWEGSNKTMLLITHDIDEALYLADRVIVMSARPGQIVQELTIDEPRPRNRNSASLVKLREKIMAFLNVA
ncbi:ATP-binding cassette domain-containing protein [Caldalkalibacillus salinus]|uniref:ATP-binding cassette domain-containing protein n=1 Tax=Caldalkalibacillus salinus TaxID=2803787 RepID=UPI001923A9F1